jgi:hypothetical protein
VLFPQVVVVTGKGVELLPDRESLDVRSSQSSVLTAASNDGRS